VKWIDTAYAQLSPETRAQLGLAVSRKPFFLYPAGMQANVPKRWGERVSKLYSPATWSHIKQLGSSAGYEFNFDSPLSDTMDSHRLCLLAETQGKQKDVVHEISRRYFEEGIALANRSSLLEVASKFGVEGAAAYLDSDAGRDEVRTHPHIADYCTLFSHAVSALVSASPHSRTQSSFRTTFDPSACASIYTRGRHAHLFMHVAVVRIYLCTWPSCASIYARGRHCKQVLASVAAHQAAGIHSIPVAIIRSGDYNATVQGSVNKTKQNKTKQNKTKQNKTIKFRFSLQLITIYLFTMGRLN
jgi:predicted DsbA family dithiol-disulfide isomerase